jgi:hypothetical protein
MRSAACTTTSSSFSSTEGPAASPLLPALTSSSYGPRLSWSSARVMAGRGGTFPGTLAPPSARGWRQFPRGLGYLAALGGVLLVIVYLGRLIVVDPETFFLKVSAVIGSLLVSPAFCLWTGIELIRNSRQVGAPAG